MPRRINACPMARAASAYTARKPALEPQNMQIRVMVGLGSLPLPDSALRADGPASRQIRREANGIITDRSDADPWPIARPGKIRSLRTDGNVHGCILARRCIYCGTIARQLRTCYPGVSAISASRKVHARLGLLSIVAAGDEDQLCGGRIDRKDSSSGSADGNGRIGYRPR